MIIELFVSLYAWNLWVEGLTDYCKLPCKDPFTSSITENTACLCVTGAACSKDSKVLSPNLTVKILIADIHNEYRNKVASGNESRGRNRAASNMKALAYDDHLQYVAQCHAKKCTTTKDECRRTEEFPVVGQNFYVSHGEALCRSPDIFRKAVKDWYQEVYQTYTQCLIYYTGCSAQYTQLIWAETTNVGCARMLFQENCHIVCNYGPSGNILGQSVYKFGKMKCTPDAKYKSLCRREQSIMSDSRKFKILPILWKGTILISILSVILN